MSDGLFAVLAVAAASIGFVHSLAPDHWVPFVAVGRAREWSARRLAGVTLLCGAGHIGFSALLGLLALLFGVGLFGELGSRLESVAGLLLIGAGVLYFAWGLRRAVGRRVHGHAHGRYDHVHDPGEIAVWTLFVVFSVDVCVALIPLMLTASTLGLVATIAIVGLYAATTVATMLVLVLAAHAGATAVGRWPVGRYGDAVAGAVIAAVGIAVAWLGI